MSWETTFHGQCAMPTGPPHRSTQCIFTEQLCATQKPMLERQMLAERKVALIRKPDHLGRRQTPVPKTNSDESARP